MEHSIIRNRFSHEKHDIIIILSDILLPDTGGHSQPSVVQAPATGGHHTHL